MSKINSKRLLSKSRFKTASECATKLYYTSHKEYGNKKDDDEFLKSLARGGFQVGSLAQEYFPGGIEIESLDAEEALAKTAELLKRDNVIIFEAAIKFENCFIRADVLKKTKNSLELIEVKAKSCDSNIRDEFYKKNGELTSDWEPYLLDVAFQKWVMAKAYPKFSVTASLMLANKDKSASVDGINQLFLVHKGTDGRTRVNKTKVITSADIGESLLLKTNVDLECDKIWSDNYEGRSFEAQIKFLSDNHFADKRITPKLTKECKNCEFRISKEMKAEKKKSGFEECWKELTSLKDFDQPLVFDIWNWRGWDKALEDGIYLARDLHEDDIKPSKNKDHGLSNSERQQLQIEAIKSGSKKPFIDLDGLASEMSSFTYPLHFIDFETTMVAIPFSKGRHPYEQIAFQFSHHVMEKDGSILHVDQYLDATPGKFPNFDFVRALKKSLEKDSGTIFRYAVHENTVLLQIYDQLQESEELDRDELCDWIKTLTLKKKDKEIAWEGSRNMVDQCELVKRYHYSPLTNGSNSLKKVLPAVLNSSDVLFNRYSQAIYGGSSKLTSLNLKNHAWLKKDDSGKVIDPYKTLPKLIDDLDRDSLDRMFEYDEIDDGGAAMTAYAMMQFTQMSEAERDQIKVALLRYCELDTFAMVLIFEYWKNELAQAKNMHVA